MILISHFKQIVSGYLTVTLFPEKRERDAALKALLGTFFVRPVVEARVSNTPNFGFNNLG